MPFLISNFYATVFWQHPINWIFIPKIFTLHYMNQTILIFEPNPLTNGAKLGIISIKLIRYFQPVNKSFQCN
mgnify:FL=1